MCAASPGPETRWEARPIFRSPGPGSVTLFLAVSPPLPESQFLQLSPGKVPAAPSDCRAIAALEPRVLENVTQIGTMQ